jgi:hypothetical protein
MQIVLEKDGSRLVVDGRGDRDVMTAEGARRAGALLEVQIEAGSLISLHAVG